MPFIIVELPVILKPIYKYLHSIAMFLIVPVLPLVPVSVLANPQALSLPESFLPHASVPVASLPEILPHTLGFAFEVLPFIDIEICEGFLA